SFDKFNPRVGKPVGIPLAGDLMASRWAFEAFMVTQFKDNPHEKKFYDLDQTVAEAEYKRIYYIPELQSKVAFCLNNRSRWRDDRYQPLNDALGLLKRELENELQYVGEDKLDTRKLEPGSF